MRYLDREDLVARFEEGELEELDPSDVRVSEVLEDTCAEIDSVLVETYALPLPSSDWPLLKSIGADIARARLYDDEAPDRVLGRLSSARKKLREVGAGERRLVNADGEEASRHPTVLVDASTPVATRERLSGFLNPGPVPPGPFGQFRP